jgi:predicted HTH domain antitoxin
MKKEQMVGARLPADLVRELELIQNVEQADRSTTVRRLLSQAIRQWKLEHYVRQYGDGKLTLARAARDAGVSVWEMMDYARARKVPAQYDLEDLERDLGTIRRSLGVSRAEPKGAAGSE